jgi:hypothetical protein
MQRGYTKLTRFQSMAHADVAVGEVTYERRLPSASHTHDGDHD